MAKDPLIGTTMGDYVIESVLGRGGMARVYRGYDTNLQRYAAVKVIDSQLISGDDSEEYYERFQREARAIARLRHPNIVGIYQFGQVDEQYYMAMVFVKGRDMRFVLKDHVSAGTLMAPTLVLKIMRAMTSALDYAHSEGVIHRDIKPSNILVMDDGTAILTDFGLALNTSDGTIGNTFGSAHYIAPEQAVSSAHAVPQSDMYSLGICLYEMLTGTVPFDDASAMSVALKHLSEIPAPPSRLNPTLTQEIEDVVMRVLEKEPNDRYETCAAFMDDLERAFQAKQVIDTAEVEQADLNASIPRPLDVTPHRPPAQPLEQTDPEPSRASVPAPPGQPSPDATSELSRGTRGSLASLSRTAAERLKVEPEARDGIDFGRLGMIAGGVVAIALIAALVFIALNAAGFIGGTTIEPTASAVAAAATDAPPTDEPTDEPSDTPTDAPPSDTPTDEPTETDAPTAIGAAATDGPSDTPTDAPPSDTPTDEPTATDAPTSETDTPAAASVLPEDAVEVELRYSSISFVLYNTSEVAVDVSALEFVREREDGTTIRVRARSVWGRGIAPPTRLPAGDCFQIWTTLFSRLPAPAYCTRQAFDAISPRDTFWDADDEDSAFDVVYGGETIAVCPIAAGECVVRVPRAE